MSLKRLKQIDRYIKDSVFGYIRSVESQLSCSNVPVLISYLCLSYYYHNEYFSKYGDDVQLSNNNMMITKTCNGSEFPDVTYGNTWIESNIDQTAKWTLKLSKNIDIYIRIVTKEDEVDSQGPEFEFNGDHCIYFKDGIPIHRTRNSINWSDSFHGTIDVILNTEDRILEIKNINDSDTTIIYKGIDKGDNIRYKLGIVLWEPLDSVTLIDFDLKLH